MSKPRLVVVLALAAAFVAALPAAAQPTKFMYVTGKMFQGAPVAPGEQVFLPNQVHLRGHAGGWYIVDAAGPAATFLPSEAGPFDPASRFLPGPMRTSINCNLDLAMQGECWGTVEMTVGEGGWVGTWSGKFDLGRLIAKFTLNAHGTGAFEGKELKLEGMGPGADADFYFLGEVVTR